MSKKAKAKRSSGQKSAGEAKAVGKGSEAPAGDSRAVPAEPGDRAEHRGLSWLRSHRVELSLFAGFVIIFALFSSQRFLRQSAAPHFVYQAKAWLEGRTDLDPEVLPNLEDWACVRVVAGEKIRCEGRIQPTDKWYVSFPPFPAVMMLPFVAVNGYQLNDTSFTVIAAALAVAFFYSLLRLLSSLRESDRSEHDNIWIACCLAVGTLFFYCAIRGEVWFTAEILGVLLTCLYVRFALRARQPLAAGAFFAMATLTRTPLFFAGLFFLIELIAPGPTNRLGQIKAMGHQMQPIARRLALFVAGAAPLGLASAAYNYFRFGKLTEFGHKFLYNNRVNADIDRWGLFNVHYLWRNLDSAFFKLPTIGVNPFRLLYDPNGLSLLLTLPVIVFLLMPVGKPRLHWPLWLTVAVCAVPGLFYQNNGYMQFGFRFSLDYTPYLLLLFAIGGWSFRNRWVLAALALALVVNFWGAVAFKGYTEYVRHW